ncbi:MAG: hypothetical protein FJ151_02250, partial [Euryarchaeota archaeon]|nr:hypothetical protein [Euryarchaeota archaeon]
SGILLMDLAGMREGRPNFKVLKDLVRRKGNVWLDIGMRSVQDLFDSFAMEASKAIASTLTAPGIGMFREVFELSDQCIPCIYVEGEVKWGRPNGNPSSLKETVRALDDIGFREVAIIDLKRLGLRQGVSRDFASRALSFDLDVLVGGGVMETDIEFLREGGAAGALLDPHTPIIRDLLGSEERPVPTEDLRSEPVRTVRPRELPCD